MTRPGLVSTWGLVLGRQKDVSRENPSRVGPGRLNRLKSSQKEQPKKLTVDAFT